MIGCHDVRNMRPGGPAILAHSNERLLSPSGFGAALSTWCLSSYQTLKTAHVVEGL